MKLSIRRLPIGILCLSAHIVRSSGIFGQTIFSCIEAECPLAPNPRYADCQVANETFVSIGFTKIPTDNTALSQLTWVQGTGSIDPEAPFKSFYLGHPSSLNLSNTGACAIFFPNLDPSLSFPPYFDSYSQGTCVEALGPGCVVALTTRARELDTRGSSEEVCEQLRRDLEERPIRVCGQPFREPFLEQVPGQWTKAVARCKDIFPNLFELRMGS